MSTKTALGGEDKNKKRNGKGVGNPISTIDFKGQRRKKINN